MNVQEEGPNVAPPQFAAGYVALQAFISGSVSILKYVTLSETKGLLSQSRCFADAQHDRIRNE